jgi:hypothetical protein
MSFSELRLLHTKVPSFAFILSRSGDGGDGLRL